MARCIIGEGPIWNEFEKRLYFTNGMGDEICMFDVDTNELKVRPVKVGVAAFSFTKDNRLIVSREDGVFILNDDDTIEELYNSKKIKIQLANDMKVGPDGRVYVGTQCEKRLGRSDKINGKLYSVDCNGNVKVLLDNLVLSNGFDWSLDEKKFYHTDSDTQMIREYEFDKINGEISFNGREIQVPGVDGFTIDTSGNLLASCWGYGHVAVIDTSEFKIKSYINIPAKIPTSCGFIGDDMNKLAITTASYNSDITQDENAGYTFILQTKTRGRKPYLFG